MKIIKTKDYEELSAHAAAIVIDQVRKNPASVLVLATGNTPLGMFAQLTLAYQNGRVSCENCSLIALDDYWNIPLDDNQRHHSPSPAGDWQRREKTRWFQSQDLDLG